MLFFFIEISKVEQVGHQESLARLHVTAMLKKC